MNLKTNIDLIKEKKVLVIKKWISCKGVLGVLDNYNIHKEYFIKNYAFGIFDFFVCIVEGDCEVGQCPVIDKFLEYLKGKNVGIDELFIICKGIKNAIIELSYEFDFNNLEINQEITSIFETNFEAISKKFVHTIEDLNDNLSMNNKLIDENIIMSTTDLKGNIKSVSTAFCEISGYTKEELIGAPHNIVRHPDTPKEIFEDLWNTIKSKNIWHGEIKNLNKNGAVYWVDAIIAPKYDKNNNHIGYSAVRQDITYKKQSQTQQDIIIEQSKATAMGEMISMIAHQWRQPLQAIAILVQKLTLEKMIEGDISEQTLNEVVGSIEDRLSYMSKIIEEFRSFFNPTKEKQNIYASMLLDQVRDFMAYSFKVDDIHFNVEFEDDINFNVHSNELIQVLVNILNNAKEAFEERHIENKKISLTFYQQNDNIVFEIKDNAGGIPSIAMPKIFEPYFSTKKNKNGTGLGLYMAKTIVEKNGKGLLTVKNIEDGACFKLVLPIN